MNLKTLCRAKEKKDQKNTQNPRIYGLNPFIRNSRTGKTYLWLKKSDQWLPQRRVQGLTWKGHEATFWEDGDVLYLAGCALTGYIILSNSSPFTYLTSAQTLCEILPLILCKLGLKRSYFPRRFNKIGEYSTYSLNWKKEL